MRGGGLQGARHSRFDRVATWVTEEPQASLPLRLLSPATRLQRIKSEAGSRVGDTAHAGRIKVGSRDVVHVVSGKSHDPQPACTCLLLIAIEFPSDLWLVELY